MYKCLVKIGYAIKNKNQQNTMSSMQMLELLEFASNLNEIDENR